MAPAAQAAGEGGLSTEQKVAVMGKHLRVELGPAAQIKLHLGVRRFVHQPAYAVPDYEA